MTLTIAFMLAVIGLLIIKFDGETIYALAVLIVIAVLLFGD